MTEEHVELFFGSEDDQVGGCVGDEGWEALRPGGRPPGAQKGEKGRSRRRRRRVKRKASEGAARCTRVKRVEPQRGSEERRRSEVVWHMEGFRADPGSEVLIQEGCIVGRVRTQVDLKGEEGREIWLGMVLLRSGKEVMGWMQA